MASTLVTPRDIDLLDALDRCPLTARQLLKLSATFKQPFTTERKIRARLQQMSAVSRVRRWPYAIAGCGAPNYYMLGRAGFRLLHGADATPPGKRPFGPVAIAHQQHTFALADFLVHLAVAAHGAGLRITNFARENAICLNSGDDHIYPDASFTLEGPELPALHYFLEIDNGTERIHSPKEVASWERKIRVYEATQDQSAHRFRVLAVAARATGRIGNILEAAATLARDGKRSLVYGIPLSDFLAQEQPLSAACFQDHRKNPVALLPERWPRAITFPRPPGFRYAPAPVLACDGAV